LLSQIKDMLAALAAIEEVIPCFPNIPGLKRYSPFGSASD
jgi:hypothetical protein